MTLPIAPSQTLYVKNLDDKISIDELKMQLYCLFSYVAPVVDIEARKGKRTRGQAWISFISIENSTVAMQRLQGFNLLGKEMYIEYSRTKTKAISEFMNSTRKFNVEEKEEDPEEPEVQSTPVLKVEGYPPKTNQKILAILFRQLSGFQKVDLKSNFALIFYNTVQSAQEAMNKFQNFKVTGEYRLSVQFSPIPEEAPTDATKTAEQPTPAGETPKPPTPTDAPSEQSNENAPNSTIVAEIKPEIPPTADAPQAEASEVPPTSEEQQTAEVPPVSEDPPATAT